MPGRIIPPRLSPGDKIAITATARKISREELQPAVAFFERHGLEVVTDERLFAEDHQFAGSDRTREALLQQYVNDPSVKAVISARGGYGTVRIIDAVDFSPLADHPKWIIGYSDITVLHSHLYNCTHMATLHAAMPVNMQAHLVHQPSIDALVKVITNSEPLAYHVPAHELNRPGNAAGPLVGGNLSVLYSLLGSASDIQTAGSILFLEDLDEYLYHIDRMMMALKRAGKLSGLAGLVVGGMSAMRDNLVPFGHTAPEIIAHHVKEYGYPVAFGFPAGHEPENMPLLMGCDYRMEVQARGLLLTQQ